MKGRWWTPTLAVLLAWTSSGATTADPFRAVRAMIREEIDQGRVPSLAVAVARRDEIVWEEAFGEADRERGIPATVHTRYALASVSKPMTATGLMVLVERGKVDPDRPVNDYLGPARLRVRLGDPRGATVRQVADHTSGLPLHYHFFSGAEADHRPPLEETLRRYGNLVTAPGERFQYSNLGYAVLEYLIARTSGQSFAGFMQEEVFRPLGLGHTAVLRGPEEARGAAVRYGADGRPIPFYLSDHGGGSAMLSCVHDLVRFGLFHLRSHLVDQAPILSDRAIRAMQKSSSRRPDGSGDYGLGWALYPTPDGYRVVRHDGGMPGASATLVLVPAERVAVAVLCNARSELPQRVSAGVLAALRPDLTRRGTGPRPVSRAGRRSARPPRRLVGTWRGCVEVAERCLPLVLAVERAAGLRARLGEQPETGLWGVTCRSGRLTAWMHGDLESATTGDRTLRLSLRLRGDRLTGAMTAFSRSPEGLPSALSHWLELKRLPQQVP